MYRIISSASRGWWKPGGISVLKISLELPAERTFPIRQCRLITVTLFERGWIPAILGGTAGYASRPCFQGGEFFYLSLPYAVLKARPEEKRY
jgi:hypothetical protein